MQPSRRCQSAPSRRPRSRLPRRVCRAPPSPARQEAPDSKVVAQRALCAAVEVASHVLPARFWRLGTLLMAICGEHENKLGDQKLADPASFWRVLLGVSPLLASARTYWPDRNDLAHFVLLRNSYIGALTQAAAGAVCLSGRDRA